MKQGMSDTLPQECLENAKAITRKKWRYIKEKIQGGEYVSADACEDEMGDVKTCGFCEEYRDEVFGGGYRACVECPLGQERCFMSPRWLRFSKHAIERGEDAPWTFKGKRTAIALCNQVLRDIEKVKLGDERSA